MVRAIPLATVLGGVYLLSGCATIFSDSEYPVTFNSTPSGATVTITDENGVDVQRDVTPFTTNLTASNGYFDAMDYTARVELACYDPVIVPLDTNLDPWYWGNIVIGGVIGMLIVDPATGAMYEIKPQYSAVLAPSTSAPCRPTQSQASAYLAPPRSK